MACCLALWCRDSAVFSNPRRPSTTARARVSDSHARRKVRVLRRRCLGTLLCRTIAHNQLPGLIGDEPGQLRCSLSVRIRAIESVHRHRRLDLRPSVDVRFCIWFSSISGWIDPPYLSYLCTLLQFGHCRGGVPRCRRQRATIDRGIDILFTIDSARCCG